MPAGNANPKLKSILAATAGRKAVNTIKGRPVSSHRKHPLRHAQRLVRQTITYVVLQSLVSFYTNTGMKQLLEELRIHYGVKRQDAQTTRNSVVSKR